MRAENSDGASGVDGYGLVATILKSAPSVTQHIGIRKGRYNMENQELEKDIAEFDMDEKIKTPTWLIQGFLPMGHMALVASQPGCGKSFFVEALATAVLFGQPFLGQNVEPGNVLIIDSDSEPEAFKRRLIKCCKYYGGKENTQNKLFVLQAVTENLRDDSLAKLILKYHEAYGLQLVIIDSLTKVSGMAEIDKNAKCLQRFNLLMKQNNLTVVFTHHISTKKDLAPELVMTCSNPQGLLMNNTHIVSTSDSLYLLASPDADGTLKTLLVRPVTRRVTIPMKQFSINLIETSEHIHLEYDKELNLKKVVTDDEKRALELLPLGEELTVKDILANAAQYFSDATLRDVLHKLEDKGYIRLKTRIGKGGKLVYERIV